MPLIGWRSRFPRLDGTVQPKLVWLRHPNWYPLIEKLRQKVEVLRMTNGKVLDLQIAAMHRLFPMYRRLIRAQPIEISTTPYHHPILPLIIDTDACNAACQMLHDQQFPSDDARRQVALAVESHQQIFQEPPAECGSRRSVSPEALALLHEYGLRWRLPMKQFSGVVWEIEPRTAVIFTTPTK